MRTAELKPPTEEQMVVLRARNLRPDRWLIADCGKNYLEVVSVRRARRLCIRYKKCNGKIIFQRR